MAGKQAARNLKTHPGSPVKLTYAFCTYNRADRLPALVTAMRAQRCPLPFELLAVNNNSHDDTLQVLARLEQKPGPRLRVVTETFQGIVPARNRAIEESLDSDILVFIDDDELPLPGLLAAVTDAILNEGADCVGGRILIDFATQNRPPWLDDEIAGFLGALDYGREPFWIESDATPIWSGNIAYATRPFREDSGLRFDQRYNREGAGVGGGEDAIMFRVLVARGARIRYRPDMTITHCVESWKMRRGYFLKLHYRAGLRHGRYRLPAYSRTLFGIPPFLIGQFLRQCARTLPLIPRGERGALRQAMNAAHALGTLVGYCSR